jgi:peptide/nickel transport system permease protein
MLFLVARCLGQLAVALVGIVTVAFFLMRAIPGDPALYMLGDFATTEALATLRARLGLDLPVWQQYFVFLAGAAQGNLGVSVVTGQPALAEIWAAVPPSAALAVAGMLVAVAAGVPL